jgi:AcrR family transcriptional regulator
MSSSPTPDSEERAEHAPAARAEAAGIPHPASEAPDTPTGDAEDEGEAPLSGLVREPQQARSRKTLSRIMEAADRLLVERGPEALTVAAIARRARASVGSFYARFDGKEELVRYLGETALLAALDDWSDHFQEALGEALADAALAPARTPDGQAGDVLFLPLRTLTDFLLETFRSGDSARLERLDRIEDPAPSRLARLEERVLGDLEQLFAQVAGAGKLPRRMAARMVLSSAQALAAEDSGPLASAEGEEVARAVSLYLAAGTPPSLRKPEEVERAGAASTDAGAHGPVPAPAGMGSVEPETAEPDPAELETAEPVPAERAAAGLDPAGPAAVESAEPEISGPDPAEPETPELATPGSEEALAGEAAPDAGSGPAAASWLGGDELPWEYAPRGRPSLDRASPEFGSERPAPPEARESAADSAAPQEPAEPPAAGSDRTEEDAPAEEAKPTEPPAAGSDRTEDDAPAADPLEGEPAPERRKDDVEGDDDEDQGEVELFDVWG